MKKGQIIKKKLLCYFGSIFISLIILVLIILIFNTIEKDEVLYFNAIKFSFLASFFGFLFFKVFNKKNLFEDITVYLSGLFICLFFAYIAPMTLDRSLSSFMIFYSVENKKIPSTLKNEEYFENFIKRRYTDAVKIGYFNCENEFCYPTNKAKATYFLFYPIGKITKTLNNYNDFKTMLNKN